MYFVTFMLDVGDQGDFAQFKSVKLNEHNISVTILWPCQP